MSATFVLSTESLWETAKKDQLNQIVSDNCIRQTGQLSIKQTFKGARGMTGNLCPCLGEHLDGFHAPRQAVGKVRQG